jgi:hypothetical protein
MPISTELLNSTFADLRGPLVNSFVRSNELFEALDKKARIPAEGGTYIERSFSGAAPARGVGIYVGDELLNMTRRQEIRKFQVEPHRIAVAINIPKKELQMNSGKLAVIRLIEEYPKTVIEGVKSDINTFLLTGASRGIVFTTAELAGLLTLDGSSTSGIGTGVTNGLLDWTIPTSQGDTVQSVTKSTSYSHFNQFGGIGTWATNGMEIMRKTYRKCAHYAGGMGKGPDLVIMDDDTYTNFEADKLSNVRVSLVDDKTEKSTMLGLDLGIAKVYSSIDLDRTTMTAVALTGAGGIAPSTGATYILNTDFMEFAVHEAPNVSKFQERVGDQDVVTAVFTMQGNLICTKTPAQGCVAGGAS